MPICPSRDPRESHRTVAELRSVLGAHTIGSHEPSALIAPELMAMNCRPSAKASRLHRIALGRHCRGAECVVGLERAILHLFGAACSTSAVSRLGAITPETSTNCPAAPSRQWGAFARMSSEASSKRNQEGSSSVHHSLDAPLGVLAWLPRIEHAMVHRLGIKE
jgi:hypothetical protein